jgi:hypothetical protein
LKPQRGYNMGFVRKIGRAIDDNIIQPIKENPLGAIVSVGAMAMGVPPVFAGAMGGAASAAESGGDILKGALIGGVAGYAGGAGASAASGAGAGTALTGAAGGAAAGATAAALTGNNILTGALTGGIGGGLAGVANEYFNPATGNTTYTYDDGSTITRTPTGEVAGSTLSNEYGLGAPVVDLSPGATQTPQAPVMNADGTMTMPNGDIVHTFDDGSTLTTRADGTYTSTPATDVVANIPGSDAYVDNGDGSKTYTYDDGSTITINADGTSSATNATDLGVGSFTGGTDAPGPKVGTPTPLTPIFPVTVPGTKTTDGGGPAVPSTPVPSTGSLPTLQVPTGLNPGFMAPTPFYQTTSPVQSQYYWGSHDYQAGPTFDAQAYNTVAAAPKTPWGLQEMGDVARPQDIVNYINSPEYQAQFVSAPAVPGRV